MADNPYSPYVDRTGGSTGWGANPTNKKGPQLFPPLPSFKPYATPAASPGSMAGMAAAISRLRTTPAGAAGAGTGAGSGSSGRGADSSGMSVQGIEGIQGIPTTGALDSDLSVAPPPVDTGPISPDSPDVLPPTDTGTGTGTSDPGNVVAQVNRLRETQGGKGMTKRRAGPQY